MRYSRVFLLSLLAAAVLGDVEIAEAEVNVNIHLGPPPIVAAEPPAVVMVPQSRLYFVPDPHVEIFFFNGYWWSPRGEVWYRSRAYNGPWGVIERTRVPRAVIYMPRDYRARYERERGAVQRVSALLEPLRAATRSPTTDIAYIVKGIPNVLARARAMIESARRELIVLISDEAFFRKLEPDLVKVARRKVKLKLAVPMPIGPDLERFAEVRSIVCSCMILVVDDQQVLTVTRTSGDDAYGITSTDETLVRLGTEYWESPRCCVA